MTAQRSYKGVLAVTSADQQQILIAIINAYTGDHRYKVSRTSFAIKLLRSTRKYVAARIGRTGFPP